MKTQGPVLTFTCRVCNTFSVPVQLELVALPVVTDLWRSGNWRRCAVLLLVNISFCRLNSLQ